MTSRQPTITGELRKWRRDIPHSCVIGIMYNDVRAIWFDGEGAVIVYQRWEDCGQYFLAVTQNSAIKCMKDEELPNGNSG